MTLFTRASREDVLGGIDQSIRQVVVGYGPAVDSGSADEVAGRFLPDGVYDSRPPGPMEGRAGIAAMVRTLANRRAAHRIADMPDYLLTDIGLRRDDVHDALNRSWRDDPTYRLAVAASRRRHAR